jgi:hypothetical protein
MATQSRKKGRFGGNKSCPHTCPKRRCIDKLFKKNIVKRHARVISLHLKCAPSCLGWKSIEPQLRLHNIMKGTSISRKKILWIPDPGMMVDTVGDAVASPEYIVVQRPTDELNPYFDRKFERCIYELEDDPQFSAEEGKTIAAVCQNVSSIGGFFICSHPSYIARNFSPAIF